MSMLPILSGGADRCGSECLPACTHTYAAFAAPPWLDRREALLHSRFFLGGLVQPLER